MSGFMVVYLLFLSVMFAMIANSSRTFTACEFLFGLLPFLLTVDFLLRFIGQQTPAQLIKPYLLLPIPKYACVESFIMSSMVTPNNLIWLFITVPYAIMSILFSSGFWAALGFIIGFQLIIIINSQNYMLWRTLITKKIFWWIGPIIIYGAMFLIWIFKDFDAMFDKFAAVGEGVASWNILYFLGIFAILALFFFINREVQYHITFTETTESKNTQMKTVSEFRLFERFGEMGEYLKLEVKSIMRNKNMRNSFLYSTIFTVVLSIVISYTDIYDGSFNSKFFMVYVFIVNGAMLLVRIMGAEGNYIDGLMIHKENILQLLHAKYYFYCALLLLPLIIMTPTIFMGKYTLLMLIAMGKYTLLMLIAMMAFTAGPLFFMLMQMAVWNKQTVPVNSKLVSKGNVETNWFAFGVEMAAMFAPVAIISILQMFMSETATYATMLVIGLLFIATHNIWLRNIYQRFMVRRYENMESFRATR